MVLVFSANANNSKWVKSEVHLAANHELDIVPFRIDQSEPTRGLDLLLGTRQWLDALTPDLKESIARLVGRLSHSKQHQNLSDSAETVSRKPPIQVNCFASESRQEIAKWNGYYFEAEPIIWGIGKKIILECSNQEIRIIFLKKDRTIYLPTSAVLDVSTWSMGNGIIITDVSRSEFRINFGFFRGIAVKDTIKKIWRY